MHDGPRLPGVGQGPGGQGRGPVQAVTPRSTGMKQAPPYMSVGLLALVAGGLIRGCAGELRGAAKPAGGQRGGLAAPPARIAPASSPPGGPWANLDQYQAIVETEDSFLITYQLFNRWGRDGI